MSNYQAARQAASFYGRQRQRGRAFAEALTLHTSGLNVVGADAFGGRYTSGAMFVRDANGNAWVALDSGVTGSGELIGSGVRSDGTISWMFWAGKLLVAPPTP